MDYLKYSTRIRNEELERLVSLPEIEPDGSGRKRPQTLSKGSIDTYLALKLWDNSRCDMLPRVFLDEEAESYAMKYVDILCFYPDDLCSVVGISDDSLRRCLKQLHAHKFIHLFSPAKDENNYKIYRVGIDRVQNPETSEGKKGYTRITRKLYEEIRNIRNVGVLRIAIRAYQENVRHNDGRDTFENASVRTMLSGLPAYTIRPAFLNKVTDFFRNLLEKRGDGAPESGIFFKQKKKKRFDILMSGGYSWEERKKEIDLNLQEMKDGAGKFGCLAAALSDLATHSTGNPDQPVPKLHPVRGLFKETFGRELSDDEFRVNYSAVNPRSLNALSTFRHFFDPSEIEKEKDSEEKNEDSKEKNKEQDFRTVAMEYGAKRCLSALKRIWTDMFNGSLKSLSEAQSDPKSAGINFGALIRSYIENEWAVLKETFGKELKSFDEERTFTPIPLPSQAN